MGTPLSPAQVFLVSGNCFLSLPGLLVNPTDSVKAVGDKGAGTPRPGYYQVSCQVRSKNDRMSFYANVDQWLGHEASWSGQTPSNAWQWVESQRAYALGTGTHTLWLLFTRAGDEIGEVRIVPVQ